MIKYKLTKFNADSHIGSIYDTEENIYIPIDEDNTEYKKYLEWVAKGNNAEEWILCQEEV